MKSDEYFGGLEKSNEEDKSTAVTNRKKPKNKHLKENERVLFIKLNRFEFLIIKKVIKFYIWKWGMWKWCR